MAEERPYWNSVTKKWLTLTEALAVPNEQLPLSYLPRQEPTPAPTPTLGERIDALVYISHLEAMNGERGYENELNEIEDKVQEMERKVQHG